MRAPRPFGRAGLKVAPLSFGAAAIGNLFTAVDDAAATEAVRTAADAASTTTTPRRTTAWASPSAGSVRHWRTERTW